MSIDEIINKIESLLDKIQDKIKWIEGKINGLLSHVPFFLKWAVSAIQDLWNKVCDKIEEFWNWFTDKLAYAGDPGLLQQTGQDWNKLLGQPTHKRAADVDSDELLVDDTWTGTAADAYKSHIGDQKSALEAVGQTYATAVSSALNGLKTGVILFWSGVIAGLISLLVGIVLATGATGTIIGIPAALATILGAIVLFLVTAGGGVLALKLSLGDTSSSLNTLKSYTDPWPNFVLS